MVGDMSVGKRMDNLEKINIYLRRQFKHLINPTQRIDWISSS